MGFDINTPKLLKTPLYLKPFYYHLLFFLIVHLDLYKKMSILDSQFLLGYYKLFDFCTFLEYAFSMRRIFFVCLLVDSFQSIRKVTQSIRKVTQSIINVSSSIKKVP